MGSWCGCVCGLRDIRSVHIWGSMSALCEYVDVVIIYVRCVNMCIYGGDVCVVYMWVRGDDICG